MAIGKQKKRKKFDGLRKLHENHVAQRPGYARAKLTLFRSQRQLSTPH